MTTLGHGEVGAYGEKDDARRQELCIRVLELIVAGAEEQALQEAVRFEQEAGVSVNSLIDNLIENRKRVTDGVSFVIRGLREQEQTSITRSEPEAKPHQDRLKEFDAL